MRNWTALTLHTDIPLWHILQLSFLYVYREHAASESINIQLCCKNKCAFIFGLVCLGCGVCSIASFCSSIWIRIQNNVPYAGGLERSATYNARPIPMPNPFQNSTSLLPEWFHRTVPYQIPPKTNLHIEYWFRIEPNCICRLLDTKTMSPPHSSMECVVGTCVYMLVRCFKYSDNEYFIVFVHDIHKVFCYFRVFCWYL